MLICSALLSCILATTGVTITEPIDGETYNGDWLTIRAVVENDNSIPDSVHYTLNGEPVIQIPRLNTDWPTYMQNYQNHGYSQSPAPMDNSILWTAYVKGFFHEFGTPVVVDGIVYYTEDSLGSGTNDSLYAFNAGTGELIWKYNTGHADDAVTVVGGRLYSASDSIFCLDALDGSKIWTSGLANHTGSTPIVTNGYVFCGKNPSAPDLPTVFCLDVETGEQVWSTAIPKAMASCMAYWNGMLFVPTAFMGGGVLGSLYALDAETGEVLWENTDTEAGYWDSSPVVVDGMIYIGDQKGHALAINAITGEIEWNSVISPSNAWITATMAYHEDRLYFAPEDSPYRCLDPENGTTLWTADFQQHGSSGIADGVVFFGESESVDDSSRVIALDCSNGAEIWSYKASSGGSSNGFQGSPSITDGVVYYTCTDGYLYAFGTGLKYTYLDDLLAQVGSNELIVTSFDGGTVAADTISFTVTGTGINLEPSRRFDLAANPNPFHSNATISFELSQPGFTSLELYDLSGRRVVCLANSDMPVGTHSLKWAGCSDSGELVSSGLYLCRIQSGGVTETTGLCLLR